MAVECGKEHPDIPNRTCALDWDHAGPCDWAHLKTRIHVQSTCLPLPTKPTKP